MSSKLPPLPVDSSAIADVEAALILIRSGKANLAIPLLERLPRAVENDITENAGWVLFRDEQRHAQDLHEAVEYAYHVGREAGHREALQGIAYRPPQKITTTTKARTVRERSSETPP